MKTIEMNVYPHRHGLYPYQMNTLLLDRILCLVDVAVPPEKGWLTKNGAECLASRTIKIVIHVEEAMTGVEEVSVQSIVAGQGLIISEDRDIMVIMAEFYSVLTTPSYSIT